VEEGVINFVLYNVHPTPTASESQLCAQITHSHLQEITTIVIIILFTEEFAGLKYQWHNIFVHIQTIPLSFGV